MQDSGTCNKGGIKGQEHAQHLGKEDAPMLRHPEAQSVAAAPRVFMPTPTRLALLSALLELSERCQPETLRL